MKKSELTQLLDKIPVTAIIVECNIKAIDPSGITIIINPFDEMITEEE